MHFLRNNLNGEYLLKITLAFKKCRISMQFVEDKVENGTNFCYRTLILKELPARIGQALKWNQEGIQ